MVTLLYFGRNPELVRKAWLITVIDRIRFKSVTKKRGVWVFELEGYNGVFQLPALVMVNFIENLGEEAKYVDFYSIK